MTMTVAEPTTSPASPPPAAATPNPITLTVTTAGLFDVLTNTFRAVGGASFGTRLRLHLADARLHATGTDHIRIHRDWTPLLDNTPAHLPEPLLLTTSDVTALRAVLRYRLAPALRTQPATLTIGPPSPDGLVRPIRLAAGNPGHADGLTVHSLADPIIAFPGVDTLIQHFPDWDSTDVVRLNPRHLADAARLTHDGRPVSHRTGLTLHFRAPRPGGAAAPVQITHPDRPSWTADVTPVRHNHR